MSTHNIIMFLSRNKKNIDTFQLKKIALSRAMQSFAGILNKDHVNYIMCYIQTKMYTLNGKITINDHFII